MSAGERLAAIYTLCGLVVLWIGWIKALRPWVRAKARRLGAAIDTLVGRDAIHDLATGSDLPEVIALPERLAGIEQTQAAQAITQAAQAETLSKMADAFSAIAALDRRVTVLEDAAGERIASKLESAALLGAVANRDTDLIDVPSTEE